MSKDPVNFTIEDEHLSGASEMFLIKPKETSIPEKTLDSKFQTTPYLKSKD
jgi:hypothetical protein